jgi:poly [ADP-ribose] polymerase
MAKKKITSAIQTRKPTTTTKAKPVKAASKSPSKAKSTSKQPKRNNLPSDDEEEIVVKKTTKTTQKKTKPKVTATKAKVVDNKTTKKADTKKKDAKAATKPASKAVKKATATSKIMEESDDEDAMDVDDTNKVVIEKNGAVVDEYVPNAKLYYIPKDKDGSYNYQNLTATLNQCDLKNNNNKFYILQVLVHDKDKNIFLFKRWGRNGYKGSQDQIVI